ncbi:glycosyltransferase family A protein [Williamsia sp. CHRR-6]|uniref:glycosyltransferase family A protein n=1 Tax=Williamsia sp. CHRR-6 TaxID=2835871 RepID=UPI001BDB0BB9|nr:glycosyltransferase family A protein [Williamsia sp. CHRR-6]MBT0567052.1 glycosyltransferase family 2 protein [Williamsia sp. CHRR-6]
MIPSISVLTALGPHVAHHLADTAQSVLGQTLSGSQTWQWVICIDGPPMPLDVPDDPRIVVIAAGRPGGPGLCRNLAAAHADAPLLRNLDADDLLLPGALASDIAALADPTIGWTTSAARDLLPDGSVRDVAGASPGRMVPVGDIARQWAGGPIIDVHVTTVAMRAETLWAAGGYTALPRSEDVSLLARINLTSRGRHRSSVSLLYRKWSQQLTEQPRDETNRRVRERMSAAMLAALDRP